jgi:hypothetical protein
LGAGKMNTAEQATELALSLVDSGTYWLGTGDCDTPRDGKSDCAGFAINKCYNIRRHRPGFNRGAWATVEDDINCNSAIEDADHKQDLFELIYPGNWLNVEVGDLLTYPTIHIKDAHSEWHEFIGHVGLISDVPRGWTFIGSGWAGLSVVQCCGPNNRRPGIIQTTGAHWDEHDHDWPKNRSVVIRPRQGAK